MAIVMALRSLIKTEPRNAKLRQVDSHCQGLTGKSTNEWMSQSLLFCSSPVCPFLILSFQVVCFWEKILQHDLACCLSIPCYLSSFKVLGWFLPVIPFSGNRPLKGKLKTEFNILHIFLKCFCISLPINAKKNLLHSLATSFFAKHRSSIWSSIWSSTVEVPFIFIDLCRFSRVDVPPSGPENVPKPCLPPYESPLSAVSSTCKEITWDKCYLWKCASCAVHCKPD